MSRRWHLSGLGSSTFAVYCVLAIALGWGAYRHSPTWNEVAHLVAGLSHWQFGRFDLYRVNPPLVRLLAAAPLNACEFKADWSCYDARTGTRSERSVRDSFLAQNGPRVFELVTLARWACIPFGLLGAYVCYRWAQELYGTCAGALAFALWCSCPYVLGHGQLITPDVGAAAFGATSGYVYWRWLTNRTMSAACLAGVVLGFAELTKMTLIVFFALWPALWLVWQLPRSRTSGERRQFRTPGQLAMILILGLYVINTCYGFNGVFQRLGDYKFVSKSFGGRRDLYAEADWRRNRFRDSPLAAIRVPLPRNYVMGVDVQKADFERGLPSYLRGRWADHGWWYYYLYALAIKVPLGTWLLLVLALDVSLFGNVYNTPWRDEMVLLAPGILILVFVSSQTGFSIHSRYALSALPFFFVWASKVGRIFQLRPRTQRRRLLAAIVVVALTWSVGSSLWMYPHSLSYFNEVVGGPRNGGAHLLSSNIDWGQDLFYLKAWLDKHPDVRLDGLAFYGSYPVTLAGIPSTPLPPSGDAAHGANRGPGGAGDDYGPKPGWYALSVNYLYGREGVYRYFLEFEPVASAGYSIYIYHITSADAARAGPSPRARFRERDTPMNSPLRKETLPAMATDRPCQTKRR